MDDNIYSLVSGSGCQLPPLLTTVCTSVSEAVYLFTCGKYLVDAEQFLRSGSLTGKPVYWGRTSCTLSVSRLATYRPG